MSVVWRIFSDAVLQIPQPTTEIAIQVGVVLLALLIAVLIITLGESLYQYRHDIRQARVHDDVEGAILTRMHESDPGWKEWTAQLSNPERQVAEDLLYDYFQTIGGEERETLARLAAALGVIEKAKKTLEGSARHKRLQALGWLALAGEPVDPDTLKRTCADDNDLRAAAARVLYEADYPDAKTIGTDLLLGDGSETLSVHGMDTLYQFHKNDPTALLARGHKKAENWQLSLLVQVLNVIESCSPTAQAADWEWVFELTNHESPSVRASAVKALASAAWDPSFREQIDITRLLFDPHRNVRRETYRMLGGWNDDASRRLLATGAYRESDQRSRVLALTELAARAELTDDLLAAGRYDDGFGWDTEPMGSSGGETLDDRPAETRADAAVDIQIGSRMLPTDPNDEAAYARAVAWVRALRKVQS